MPIAATPVLAGPQKFAWVVYAKSVGLAKLASKGWLAKLLNHRITYGAMTILHRRTFEGPRKQKSTKNCDWKDQKRVLIGSIFELNDQFVWVNDVQLLAQQFANHVRISAIRVE